MSHQSMSLDLTPFQRYFVAVIRKVKGVEANTNDLVSSLILSAEKIPLQGHKTLMTTNVDIVLSLVGDHSCYVVREFKLSSPLVLRGTDFLAHYGKRLAREGHDLSNLNRQRLWTMSCAADLQAMLVAYDKLAAKEFDLPVVFGH